MEEIPRKNGRFVKGYTQPESIKEKIRLKASGKKHSEESKNKISASKKGSIPWNKGKKIPYRPRPGMKGKVPWNKQGKEIVCICGKSVWMKPYRIKKGSKYCSKDCAFADENNHKWKGNDVSYSGLHKWVTEHKGKAKMCINCQSTISVQWASKSHKYLRNIDDWLELCSKCHGIYDSGKNRGAIKRRFKNGKS